MFDDIKAFLKPISRPIQVKPAIPQSLSLDGLKEAVRRCETWQEFLTDPFVNPHYRGYCYVNAGLIDPEKAYQAWIESRFPCSWSKVTNDDILGGIS